MKSYSGGKGYQKLPNYLISVNPELFKILDQHPEKEFIHGMMYCLFTETNHLESFEEEVFTGLSSHCAEG